MANAKNKSNVFYCGPLRKDYPVMEKGEGIYFFDEGGVGTLMPRAG
jgi:hypothetical protein